MTFKKWNPTKKYLRDKVIEEFRQDYFLCSPGSPFLDIINKINNKTQFYGWEYDKIRMGVIDLPTLGTEQRKIWSHKKQFEKSFWAFLIKQFALYCDHVEPVEIFWFPIPIDKSTQNAPHPFHPLCWNTGSCHRMSGEPCRIFVVRWQEAWKVLCHEVFHWLRLGSSLEMPSMTNLWKTEKQWASRGPLLLEEAWVEALASIWFPRWLLQYYGQPDDEEKRMRLFGNQFRAMTNFCRESWASSSPNKQQCLQSMMPFDDSACNQWYQDTNVYSYVFWKEKIWHNTLLMNFLKQDLGEQLRQLQNSHIRLRITIELLRLLEEPMPVGYHEPCELRFLPKVSLWFPSTGLRSSEILLG